MGSGANTEYLPKQNKIISVCIDCAWAWIKFLEAHPDKETTEHEAKAIGITKSAAVATCPKKRLATEKKDDVDVRRRDCS